MFNLKRSKQDLLAVVPEIEPFYFIVPMKVVREEEVRHLFPPGARCTAAAGPDGIVFVQEFMDTLTPAKQRGLVLHEVMHIARGDLSGGWVDTTIPFATFCLLRNVAQDVCIEWEVAKVGRGSSPVPATPATDKKTAADFVQCNADYPVKYRGWGWRAVYDDLKSLMSKMPGGGEGLGSAGMSSVDQVHPGEGGPEQERQLEEARSQSEAIRAASSAEKGDVRGDGWMRVMQAPPVVPWQTVLREILTTVKDPEEKTWRRISRRALARGQVQRGVGDVTTIPKIQLFVDTSGSMHDTLDTVAGDLMVLLRDIRPRQLEIIYYDVRVMAREKFDIEDMESAKVTQMPSGGGTSIRGAVEELVVEADFVPCPMVVLTDGQDDYSLPVELQQELGQVVWVSYDVPVNCGFGRSITIGGRT